MLCYAVLAAEQVVAMLRFVVREAQNLMMRRKHSRASSSSSRDSDTSDTSRTDQDAAAANNSATAAAAAAGGAGGAASTSSMDTGSSSDGSSSSSHENNRSSSSGGKEAGASSSSSGGGSKSKGVKPGDIPPGETSLTDVQLLLAVQQMADEKQGTQQLILHQVRFSYSYTYSVWHSRAVQPTREPEAHGVSLGLLDGEGCNVHRGIEGG